MQSDCGNQEGLASAASSGELPGVELYKVERSSVVVSVILAIVVLFFTGPLIFWLSMAVLSGFIYLGSTWILGMKMSPSDMFEITFIVNIPIAAFVAYLVGKRIYLVCRWKKVVPDGHNCHQCRYDLTGNESGVCPECGTPIATSDS
ncbi:MAG TPA: hypothetical protein PKN33_11595 [Phycisphaerae bacterium]|nr:hypothetical protein [Phycisphaerae bacterium]